MHKNKFNVGAYEPGFHSPKLPTWTDELYSEDVFDLDFDIKKVERIELPDVPGGFQLLNVLTEAETQKLINISEMLGYDEDAIVSFDQALEIKPDYSSAFYNKAVCYSLQHETNLAIKNLQQAINLDPKYQEQAKTDIDFDDISNEPIFRKLILG